MRLHCSAMFLCCVVCSLMPAGHVRAQDSVAYQINASHTGSITMPGFRGPLEKKWSVDLGADVSYPLAAQGKVFATTARPGSTGAYSALFALDAGSGETAWHVQYPSIFPRSTACYDNGKVFMFLNNFNDSRLMAYDALTGAMVWNSRLVGQYSFTSPPTAGNGMVYLSGAGSAGDLYAVRQSDGATAWRAFVENGDVSSPAVTAEGVYVSYAGPQTYKFDPMSGRRIWHFNSGIEGGGGMTPVLYDGKLYVRDVYGPYFGGVAGLALDAMNGQVVGSFAPNDMQSPIIPAFDNGLGFFLQRGTISVKNVSTGSVLWTKSGGFVTAPVIINGIVYLSNGSHYITAYDEMTGALVQTLDAGAPVTWNDEYFTNVKGLGAGQGLLLVPAGHRLVAFGPSTPVPEPTSLALLGCGLLGVFGARRRQGPSS